LCISPYVKSIPYIIKIKGEEMKYVANLFLGAMFLLLGSTAFSQEMPNACLDGSGPHWQSLWQKDFVPVNGKNNTWTWKEDILLCSGEPIGVMRTKETYTNFELVLQWRHLKSGGNSGVFLWIPGDALQGLEPGKLPKKGIEVQALDHGFREQYKKRSTRPDDWFSTHGDVFAVGESTLDPFSPTSPNGKRSFPSKNLSKGAGEWNHYYVRAINGEIRLWVNGQEVSGGNNASPRSGYLCLESEGSPIEFKNIKIRVLP
jgi:hypothetical protein